MSFFLRVGISSKWIILKTEISRQGRRIEVIQPATGNLLNWTSKFACVCLYLCTTKANQAPYSAVIVHLNQMVYATSVDRRANHGYTSTLNDSNCLFVEIPFLSIYVFMREKLIKGLRYSLPMAINNVIAQLLIPRVLRIFIITKMFWKRATLPRAVSKCA